MTIHAPDDDLDERWKAMHEHPEFKQIESFDALDLPIKAHANDPPPEARHVPPRPVQATRHEADTDEMTDEEDTLPAMGEVNIDAPAGDLKEGDRFFDDDEAETPDQQIGHKLMNEEFRNYLNRPTEIEVDDYPI